MLQKVTATAAPNQQIVLADMLRRVNALSSTHASPTVGSAEVFARCFFYVVHY
jgi:hypothetical protein